MKNKEKYFDEIAKIFVDNNATNCSFRRTYILKIDNCEHFKCEECNKKTKIWLETEYKEDAEIDIDWSKVPPDTLVKVSNNHIGSSIGNSKRIFLVYLPSSDYPFITCEHGKSKNTTTDTTCWKYCELAFKKDIEKYRKGEHRR